MMFLDADFPLTSTWLILGVGGFVLTSTLAAVLRLLTAGFRAKLLAGLEMIPDISENVTFLRKADTLRQEEIHELHVEVAAVRQRVDAHVELPRHKNGKVHAASV